MTGSGFPQNGGGVKKTGLLLFSLLLMLALLMIFPCLTVLPSGNAAALYALFERHQQAGLGEHDLRALSETLADYLALKNDSAQVMVRGAPAFSESELIHLKDVRDLYAISGKAALLGGLIIAGVLIVCLTKAKNPRKGFIAFLKLLHMGSAMLIGLFLALCLCAFSDFSGLFHAFHRLAFANDLWLLDPSKDLLIQLMPEPFFIAYLMRYALPWLLLPIFLNLPLYRLFETDTEKRIG